MHVCECAYMHKNLNIVFKCVSMAVACMCVEGMTTNECERICIDKGI